MKFKAPSMPATAKAKFPAAPLPPFPAQRLLTAVPRFAFLLATVRRVGGNTVANFGQREDLFIMGSSPATAPQFWGMTG